MMLLGKTTEFLWKIAILSKVRAILGTTSLPQSDDPNDHVYTDKQSPVSAIRLFEHHSAQVDLLSYP
jgi:hypothetical protein